MVKVLPPGAAELLCGQEGFSRVVVSRSSNAVVHKAIEEIERRWDVGAGIDAGDIDWFRSALRRHDTLLVTEELAAEVSRRALSIHRCDAADLWDAHARKVELVALATRSVARDMAQWKRDRGSLPVFPSVPLHVPTC